MAALRRSESALRALVQAALHHVAELLWHEFLVDRVGDAWRPAIVDQAQGAVCGRLVRVPVRLGRPVPPLVRGGQSAAHGADYGISPARLGPCAPMLKGARMMCAGSARGASRLLSWYRSLRAGNHIGETATLTAESVAARLTLPHGFGVVCATVLLLARWRPSRGAQTSMLGRFVGVAAV